MSVKNAVLLALAVILFGSGTTTLCSGQRIQGGKVYKSPKHVYTIVVPSRHAVRSMTLRKVPQGYFSSFSSMRYSS